VSVVLSAQTTDVAVNRVTPKLFARFPDARALAAVEPREVEPFVASLGFFRMKSKSIVGLSRGLVERHGGEVPQSMDDLVKLPGVGRKTANVVLGVLWNKPEGVVVDTHVMRLSQRLGWTRNTDAEKIERDLCAILPRDEWDHTGHVLIFHGRRVCFARKPDCMGCSVNDVCPAAFDAEHVGRKTANGTVRRKAANGSVRRRPANGAVRTKGASAQSGAMAKAKNKKAKKSAKRAR
jgi:endonuclease-3